MARGVGEWLDSWPGRFIRWGTSLGTDGEGGWRVTWLKRKISCASWELNHDFKVVHAVRCPGSSSDLCFSMLR